MKRFVITGGPCTGKTATLTEIANRGFKIEEELARKVIEEEQKKERDISGYIGCFPWSDIRRFETFERRLLEEQARQDREPARNPRFHDRGFVDVLAYAELRGVSLIDTVREMLQDPVYEKVFVLERLPFYVTDKQRKETPEEAIRIHNKICEVYDRFGFDILTVPAMSPEERVDFILGKIGKNSREIESKFRVDNLERVRQTLIGYEVKRVVKFEEANEGLFLLGRMLRLRQNGQYDLTFKGADQGERTKDRLELPVPINSAMHGLLKRILPTNFRYSGRKEVYSPLGNRNCKISLDQIKRLGNFVEIESTNPLDIPMWKGRLGLTEEVRQSYAELARA